MRDIKIFENSEFGQIEIIAIDGKEYFAGTQCARILGYSNPQKAIRDHCKSDGVTKRSGVSTTINQYGEVTEQKVEKTYISEGNLYRLIIRSNKPEAEKFEKWVFEEVLPSIRKTGMYSVNKEELNKSDWMKLCEIVSKTPRTRIDYLFKVINKMTNGEFEDIKDRFVDIKIKVPVDFPKKLNSALKEKRMTQDELARQIGCAKSTISRYMNSRCRPNETMLEKISRVLDAEFYD